MKQPNVLIIQRILPPYRLAFFQRLSASKKMQITLAYGQASAESALDSIAHPEGLQTETLQNVYWGKNEQIVQQRGLYPLLRSQKYDVIISEFNPRIFTNIQAMRQAKRRGIRFIWWGHGIRPSGRMMSLYKRLAMPADALIFYSEAGREGFVSIGIPAEKTFVAWNSVDTVEIDRLRENRPFEERKRILCISRLIAEKKIDLLVRGFAKATSALPPSIRLTLIGDGPERKALENLVCSEGIGDRVDFVGSLYTQDKLAPYFNDSLMSVSPGYIGLSAIHSMAYGVPMLVADKEPHSPEIAAIEENINARYFQADSADDLAQNLISLVQKPQSLEQMGEASHQTVQARFSVEAMTHAFEQAVDFALRKS